MQILFYTALAVTVFCALALLLVPILMRPTREAQRLLGVVRNTRPDQRKISRRERVEEGLLTVARDFRAWLGITESTKVSELMVSAGIRRAESSDLFFAAQCLLPLLGVVAGSFARSNTFFWITLFAAVGYLLPNTWLNYKISRRRKRISRGLPDAIDLLVICVDAGLGLDQALLRVSAEIALNHPDIQEEFNRVNLEQRAGVSRLEAFQNLANRTKIPEFATFVSMLTQTDRFGTPIVKALGRYSDDLRLKRRQSAEEAAAKTKIKIVFPLVFCIFPCLFIVLLGPAILSIISTLGGLGK